MGFARHNFLRPRCTDSSKAVWTVQLAWYPVLDSRVPPPQSTGWTRAGTFPLSSMLSPFNCLGKGGFLIAKAKRSDAGAIWRLCINDCANVRIYTGIRSSE